MELSDEKCMCVIYRSERRTGAYLYTPLDSNEQTLDAVPTALRESLGKLTEVMQLALNAERKLAGADVMVVMKELVERGFYLQMPPGTATSASDRHNIAFKKA
ncbi:MAG: YcgL domain-containing protein [Pseudomonadales bacterium]|nr:YcgL domain-containing protein [Pseudomonadales bacterium]